MSSDTIPLSHRMFSAAFYEILWAANKTGMAPKTVGAVTHQQDRTPDDREIYHKRAQ